MITKTALRAFAIVGVMHMAINWRALVLYFRDYKIVLLGAAMLFICAVLLFGIGDSDRDIDDDPKGGTMQSVRDLRDER
jgi:hypothetical protein